MSAGVSRVGTAQYDAGLRAYMLGIYNHMTLGLAISAFVALGAYRARGVKSGVAWRSMAARFEMADHAGARWAS